MTIPYLAGIIDGEGHFCRPRNKNGEGRAFMQSRIIVTNTHLPLLESIKVTYGGSIRVRTPSRTNNLVCYTWSITGKRAEELARLLQPYLIVKSEQVKRVLPP